VEVASRYVFNERTPSQKIALLAASLGDIAHVTYGPSGTRTTVGLPGTGLSYTHLEKSHPRLRVTPDATVADAALGIAQIRHSVANPSTLKVVRVIVMPSGALCYQFHLTNSRGIRYGRAAVKDGAVLKTSRSIGFAETWNRICAHGSGRDITAEVHMAQ
jgi:hypothetical protein